jgi:hypothetical protein
MSVDKEKCLEILDRAIMRPIPTNDEFRERAQLIGTILNRIKPIPDDAPPNVKEVIDVERQLLVIRVGWNKMSMDELKMLLKNPALDGTGLA